MSPIEFDEIVTISHINLFNFYDYIIFTTVAELVFYLYAALILHNFLDINQFCFLLKTEIMTFLTNTMFFKHEVELTH